MDCAKSFEIGHQPRCFIANKEQAHGEIYDEIATDRTDGYMVPAQNVLTNQFKPESSRTTNYKQLLIGIIGGCLLTLLIGVPTVYFAAKSNSSTAGDNANRLFFKNFSSTINASCVEDNYLPLKFDKSTLHQSVFISEDGLKLSNFFSRDTPVAAIKNPNTLSKYKGVIGNRCFDRYRKMYLEVRYEFIVIDKFVPNQLIFEVGLAERQQVDNFHFVGSAKTRGWSFNLNICNDANNSTCLEAKHNDEYPINLIPLCQVGQGSKHSGKFGFIVDTSQETFSIIRNSSTGTLTVNSFQNVFSVQRLCPVFGVYNPHTFEVNISLLNTYDFSEAVWDVVIV